jgi:alpha-ketoglutarate-dependent 2,4-dichlorophenoxyacetate dioxygenase
MPISIREIQPGFAGEVDGVDMRQPITPGDVAIIREAIDRLAVLVFHNQVIDDQQQAVFSRNFGDLARGTEYTKPGERRLPPELTDASNIGPDGRVRDPNDRGLMNNYGSRRWHTDGSYKAIRGGYSFLSGRAVPPSGGETQFADMRAGYDALSGEMRTRVENLMLQQWIFRAGAGGAAAGAASAGAAESAHRPQIAVSVVACLACGWGTVA